MHAPRWRLVLCACLTAAAAAATFLPDESAPNANLPDLAGRWQMFLPAGFEKAVTLTPLGENRFRLGPQNLNSSGVYELREDRLVIVEPKEPYFVGYEWTLRSRYLLTLTGEPERNDAHGSYLGAVLFRHVDALPLPGPESASESVPSSEPPREN